MKKFTRVNDNSEFEIENKTVYKLVDGKRIELPDFTATARRITRLASGKASSGTKKKFGIKVEEKTTNNKKKNKK